MLGKVMRKDLPDKHGEWNAPSVGYDLLAVPVRGIPSIRGIPSNGILHMRAPWGCQFPSCDVPPRQTVPDAPWQITAHVRAAFKVSEGRYGSPRVHAELREEHGIGRKRVARLMRAYQRRARPRCRYVVTTPVAPQASRQTSSRKFDVTSPNQIWVSDLTYLRTTTGFACLAVILAAMTIGKGWMRPLRK